MENQTAPIRILIADEQPIFRHGLRRLLEADRSIHVVGEAPDGSAVVNLVRQVKPQVLLLDFALPLRSELEAPNGLFRCAPEVRIVVMVTGIEKTQILEAFRLGACGVVTKTATLRVLLNSVRSVAAGHYWLEGEGVTILVDALRKFLSNGNGSTSPKDCGLTPRELEIISNIVAGRSNKEVGQEFRISERTVKHHLTNIFTKVGVSNRLELALFAINRRITSNQVPSFAREPLEPEESL
ncbi:MAG: LuxR C-terminal-related transcriptional regulator [Terriglobia bacterium]